MPPSNPLSKLLALGQKTQDSGTANGAIPPQDPASDPNMVEKYRKTNDSKQLVAWVRNEYQSAKSARNRVQLQWNLNLAFYYGNQYLEVSPMAGGRLYMPKAPPHRVRQTANRIRPLIRRELARITSQKPSASAVPASSEDEDLAAAYAAEQVWESISKTAKLDPVFSQTAWWMLLTGVGFMKTWWDKTIQDDDGNPGKVCLDTVTPYHMFVPDLRQTGIQEQPFVINAFTRPVEWINRFYKGQVVATPDVVSTQELVSDTVLNITSGGKSEPDSVLCLELWAKPGAHALLPNGGMLYTIGDQLVSVSPDGLPYQHQKYPFVKFDHIPTGKFYSESTIPDLIGLQREYNRTRSQIVEAKNRTAKPQLVVQKGSVDVSKMTTEAGQVIEYKPGMNPPQPLPLQSLPPYVLQELDRIIMDMEDISGQHEVSKGNIPSGVTAATAISYLQEKDDSILGHTYASVEEGLENVARQALGLVKQYWDLPRMVKVVGSDGFFDVLMLQGSDLTDDIRMEGGSSLPTSKAARQAFIMDLMKMGFVKPEDGLKLLEIGGVQQLNRRLKVDESQAQRENIKLKRMDPAQVQQYNQQAQMQVDQQAQQMQMQLNQQHGLNTPPQDPNAPQDPNQQQQNPQTTDTQTGMPLDPPAIIPVNNWDNHAVHIQVHNDFRKSQSYDMLDDSIKQEFERHVNTHVQAVNDAFAQVQMATGGMPPHGQQGGPTPPTDPNAGPPEQGLPDPNAGMTPQEGTQNGGY